jgi:hypothetical protein
LLEVVGHLEPVADIIQATQLVFGEPRVLPVIHGRTPRNDLITVTDGWVSVKSMSVVDHESAVLEIRGQYAFIGALIDDPDADSFRRLDLILGRLTDWADLAPIEVKWDRSPKSWSQVSAIVRRTDPISAVTTRGTIRLHGDTSSKGDRANAQLLHTARLSVQRDDAVPTSQWIDGCVRPLRYLVSLATGRAVAIERMSVSLDHETPKPIEVAWRRESQSMDPDRLLGPSEMLFTVRELGERFETAIQRWFQAFDELAAVLDLFFATRHMRMFEENRFLNLVQALEAYHRRRMGGRPDEAAHAARVASIMGSAPSTHRAWLGELLRHAGEYSFADRIGVLVDAHPWLIGDIIAKKKKFVGTVAQSRHFHTHWDPAAVGTAPTSTALWPLNERLVVLAEACLLSELGIPEEKVASMIRRGSRSYQTLKLNPTH